IPFETVVGNDADKEPEISLNSSGEYQARAQAHMKEMLGADHVFRAGTIHALTKPTASAFVRRYYDECGVPHNTAGIKWWARGCAGVKRITGQHPGRLIIVPQGHSIYEFCPVQYPADKADAGFVITHFDYHSLNGRFMQLDILGHDAPTIIHMLHDATGIDPHFADLMADLDENQIDMLPQTTSRLANLLGMSLSTFGKHDKAQAISNVMMLMRIAYFKIYHPYSFYAALFSVKCDDFDYETMCRGREAAQQEKDRIYGRRKEMSDSDNRKRVLLEVVVEMYARGIKFLKPDLYMSQATRFIVTPDGLMPPFCSIQGIGIAAAQNIIEERVKGKFLTVEDFRERTKANKTVIELLKANDILDGLPVSDHAVS
ncbi:MAG: hypothetical protein FWE68_05155, partial [Defluviitaleaceae bacterium]|nr:hypothetical protein [Defluviitaleaceae bacterium]